MSRFATIAASLAFAIALPGMANAAPVTVRDNPDNGGSVFAAGLARSINIELDGMSRSVGAGAFSLQYGSDADGWTDFLTFCLQLRETLTLPKDHERVSSTDYIMDSDDRDALGILYGNFMDVTLGLKDANSAAAMQAIVWEITEDGASAFDLTSGVFKLLTVDVLAEANTLWGLIISGVYAPVDFNVFAAEGTQDLLTASVPVPAALPLLLSGLAGLGFASRQKKARP